MVFTSIPFLIYFYHLLTTTMSSQEITPSRRYRGLEPTTAEGASQIVIFRIGGWVHYHAAAILRQGGVFSACGEINTRSQGGFYTEAQRLADYALKDGSGGITGGVDSSRGVEVIYEDPCVRELVAQLVAHLGKVRPNMTFHIVDKTNGAGAPLGAGAT